MTNIPPLCVKCRVLLIAAETSIEHVDIAACPLCKREYVQSQPDWLPADEETNLLFGETMSLLCREGYSASVAASMVKNYYIKFRDQAYCCGIGLPVQDDDFFHHEGARGMAQRVHYYLGVGGDPAPSKFIEWRSNLRRA